MPLGTAKVVSVKRLQKKDKVYNITVDGNHNYFANGILTKNCDLIVTDETHTIDDDVMNRKLTPMVKASSFGAAGGAGGGRIVKIGISCFANNFKESCLNPTWTHLVFPWYNCPNLYNGGTVTVDGKDYPISVVKDMPLTYKQKYFPNNPELHYPSENNLSEEDFDTQYEMKWVDGQRKFLTQELLESMMGEHSLLSHGRDDEDYYFGLDLAGGLLINQGTDRDSSALTIIRKFPDGMKHIVGVYTWQGDIVEQMQDIISIIDPKNGVFKCKFGTADYGSLGTAVVDILTKAGLPIVGIRYRSAEPTTGMPYKTAIFDHFFAEMQQGYVKYPNARECATHYLLQEHMDEWEALERTVGPTGQVKIAAPTSGNILHDDCPNSATLAVWAADKMQDELRRISRRGLLDKILSPNISGNTTAARFGGGIRTAPPGLSSYFGKGGFSKR